MRKIFTLLGIFILTNISFAQVTSDPPEDINPEDTLIIYVDLSLLNQSLDHVQNLMQAYQDGEDMYMWTWNPYEFPDGHPKANGTGGRPWQNSNDILKMTPEGGTIFSYKMIPTEFYEVDAQTVYLNDIQFLIKPKNGGGYGDPDYKSEDLTLPVDPPSTVKSVTYGFPSTFRQDDVTTVYYDNDRETKASMQNLDPDSCYLYSECTLTDGTVIRIAPFFNVGDYPELKMEYYEDSRFRLSMQPAEFFGLAPGQQINTMKFLVMKKVYLDNDDRTDEELDGEVCP